METQIEAGARVPRNFGLDWLRTGCILMLFPFHTARIFDKWEPNYIKDAVNAFSSWFVLLSSYWLMPLMFCIAGISAYYALKKRAPGEYVKERVLRLAVPFLFGVVFIVPIQGYLARVQQYGYTGGYLNFLPSYFTDFSDLTGYTGGFTPELAAWLMILTLLGLSQAYCNKPGKALAHCAGASFPVYILHHSVMMAVGFFVVPLPLPLFAKFLLIAVVSLLFSLAGYELLRRFRVTRFLFGMK
ncbi:MAG TPA: acyltransferase family protein [Feifaniaceae bacterium]|nr:acyltransferase family protein [Feifaniaceae bacterium]